MRQTRHLRRSPEVNEVPAKLLLLFGTPNVQSNINLLVHVYFLRFPN
mgnify:CR=1 FL=1